MSLQTLFSSDELEVVFQPGKSETLLITFSAMDFSTKTDAFWGRYFADKAGFSAIGFVARSNNWYPRRDMEAAAKQIAGVLSQYPLRVTYGSSMGAYGAIKYSRLLGATACAAFGPQVTINPVDGALSHGYTQHFKAHLHDDMIIKGEDICPQPYVFFDPWETFDKTNALLIASVAPQTHLIAMPHTGHECIKVMVGLEIAKSLLNACLNGDTPTVEAMCRRQRAKSPARYAGVASALVNRNPELAFRIISHVQEKLDKKQLGLFHDAAAGAYVAKGDLRRAEENAIKSLELVPNRTSFLRRLAGIYERAGRLDEALALYEQYLTLNPIDATLQNTAAGIYLTQHRLDEAEAASLKAVQIAPANLNFIRRLSKIRIAQGRAADAATLLVEAVAAHPANAGLYAEIAELLEQQGRSGEAAPYAQQAQQLNRDEAAAAANLTPHLAHTSA